MFIKIPFESEIEFKSNISEITKMSLEHDYNVNDDMVLGNFYISGEYKCHEVSINTEEFRYTLPFTVDLRNDINKDTLEFNIEDFSYEIVKNNTLKVNIEYSLEAEMLEKEEREEDLFESVDEDSLESELSLIDNVIPEVAISEEKEEKEDTKDEDERELKEEDEKTILETIKDEDDTFVTYHIHIVKESETLESISTLYNVPIMLIKEYNDSEVINAGDKILIPKCDE